MSVHNADRRSEPHARAIPTGTTSVDLHMLVPLAAWIRATRGDPALEAVCEAAGVAPETFFSDRGRVVPVAQMEAWLEALRDRLGGDGGLLAAGMASEPPGSGTPRWIRWFVTPQVLYRTAEARRWLMAGRGRLAVRRSGPGGATITYVATDPPGRATCLLRQARLAQRTRAWRLPPAVVQELQCLSRGDDACEYVVHWQARPRWMGTVVATATVIAGLVATSSRPGPAWSLPAIVAGLAQAIEVERVRRSNAATNDAFGAAFRRATAVAALRPVQTSDANATPATSPQTLAGPATASVRREGDFWRLTYQSKTVLVRHSRGISLLVHLLRNPGEDMHVSALDALSPSDTSAAMPAGVPDDVPVGHLGDAGEVLDAKARATYRRRIGELREELAEAERNNDVGRAAQLRVELEAITDQLRQATGLGGRTRKAASNADRIRVAVTRRIRAAIAQIEKHHGPLGAHLSATVHTGYFCSYGPGGVDWEA